MGRLATAEVVEVDKKPNLAFVSSRHAPRPTHKKRSGAYHPGNQQKKGRWNGPKRGGQQGGQHGGWRQGGGDPGAGPSVCVCVCVC